MSEGISWPKNLREAVPSLVWGVFIFAAGFEGVAFALAGEWPSAIAGFALCGGLTLVLIYFPRLREWATGVSPNWIAGAIASLLIVVALSPFIEEKRWPFSVWFPPTPTLDQTANAVADKLASILPKSSDYADAVVGKLPKATQIAVPSVAEIADAVVSRLPKQQAASPSQKSPPPESFANPLRSKIVKWQIVAGLRSLISTGALNADCKVMIIRLQEPYAEDYADDLKQILNVLGWKYDERFATSTIPKEMTVKADNSPGPSKDCGTALGQRIQNDASSRNGSSLSPHQWMTDEEAQSYRKRQDCTSGCVEVDFGNEDPTR
jgi:hypothetical protein